MLDALVAGASNKVIAFDLGLSVRTVEVHRARMMERLGTRQLAEAIRLAVLATLAPPPGSTPRIERAGLRRRRARASFLVLSSCVKRSPHSKATRSTIHTDRGPKSLITPCCLK